MRQVKKVKKSAIPPQVKWTIAGLIVFAGLIFAFFMTPPGKAVIRGVTYALNVLEDKAHLRLERVVIEGHARTTKEQVMSILNIAQGMPILDIDLEEVRQKVSALPWVRSALVERHFPSGLRIVIVEKTPIAVWQNRQKYFPLDQDGQTINDTTTVLNNLVLVVGTDAPQNTPELVALLERHPQLAANVRSAVRVGERRWNLIFHDLNNGVIVYLPETDMESAVRRLQSLQEKGQILDKDLKVIDLRLSDRLIVRTSAELIDTENKDTKK